MFDNRHLPVIVYVQLDTSDSILEIFEIPLDFGIASQLVARKVRIMRTQTEIVMKGMVLGERCNLL